MPERTPVVTLTSDFGTADPFVACMKGVILGLHGAIRIVDISHDIPPHDIVDGAFKLRCAFPFFPSGTVHVAVVDPGVGAAPRPRGMGTETLRLRAPDNPGRGRRRFFPGPGQRHPEPRPGGRGGSRGLPRDRRSLLPDASLHHVSWPRPVRTRGGLALPRHRSRAAGGAG